MNTRSWVAPLALALVLAGEPAWAEEAHPPEPSSDPVDDAEGEGAPSTDPGDPEGDDPPPTEPGADAPPDPTASPPAGAAAEPASSAEVEALRAELEFLRFRLEALEATPSLAPPPSRAAPNVFNPRITGFIDLAGTVGFDEDGVEPAFDVRAFELDFRADIDPFARAVVVLGFENPLLHALDAHAEDAAAGVDDPAHVAEAVGEAWLSVVEEANISFVALPAHLLLELGLVRMDFGSLNRSHLHDVPHLDYPGALTSLVGEEGWGDAGAFLRYRLHNPKSLPIDFKIGVMARGPEPLMEGRETPTPVVLGRFTGSADFAPGNLFSGGFSYVGWRDATDELRGFHLASGDFLLKLRPPHRGQYRSFFLQGEAYFANRLGEGGRNTLAGFLGLGFQPARGFFVSLRGDALVDDLTAPDVVWGAGVAAAFYTSEFLRFRLAYDLLGQEHLVHRLGLQVTAVFGSHPVEPYWVNR